MLEKSFGTTFFLKTPRKKQEKRSIYLRISVDGITQEISTRRTWFYSRWDKEKGRATGSKEDARSINFFLDSLIIKVNNHRNLLLNTNIELTTDVLIKHIRGEDNEKIQVLVEFEKHNKELQSLIPSGEVAAGTYTRYVTSRSHVKDFIEYKYKRNDILFRELNYAFIKEYELYLKTVRGCNNNTTLKYIANFKKIVFRAIAKEYIATDPFKLFKGKKTPPNKKPLSKYELQMIENKQFTSARLETIRDIFVFQCYTGLAYADVYKLKTTNIVVGIDGELWIVDNRKKSTTEFNVPLLPKAMEIMEKYRNHPDCILKGTVLPVKSNQKMNEYLKEIAELCGITSILNTHKARRTFGSTVTLANDVPIHIVKNMLGHKSVRQTEEYAITEQQAISREMINLRRKLTVKVEERNTIDRPERLRTQIDTPPDTETIVEDSINVNDKLELIKKILFG